MPHAHSRPCCISGHLTFQQKEIATFDSKIPSENTIRIDNVRK